MRELSIGVVGCGTAGPAAALLLARDGHRVTLYERVAAPEPIGAGIMLQPTGQAVLRELGLLELIEARGARIDRLRVEREHERPLLTLRYEDAVPGAYGIGLHRGALFQALFDAVKRAPIDLRLGVELERFHPSGKRVAVRRLGGAAIGEHDLLVVADGARSRLRDQLGLVRRAVPYPWGALWFMAEDPDQTITGELFQVVSGTQELLGLLPTGFGPRRDVPLVSIFWSMRADAVASFRRSDLTAWKGRVLELAPCASHLLEQIRVPEDLLFSGYMDVVMNPWNGHRVACIGDAAHAMSPQLGQGANLALYDAYRLAMCLRQEDGDVVRALDAYSRDRRGHLDYYQRVTRWLTPFFQSDHASLGWLRDVAMPIMNRFGTFNRAMVLGMCGAADGHPWRSVKLPSS